MSSENQQDEQFKLVSIDGSSKIKASSNRAKQAYSSYLKSDDDDENDNSSQLSINETLDESKEVVKENNVQQNNVPKKQENNQKQVSKPPVKGTAPLKSTKNTKKVEEIEEDDYFNDDGSIKEDRENAKNNIQELKNSIASLLGNFIGALTALFAKLGALLMKPISMVLDLMIKVMNIPLGIMNKFIASLSNKLGDKAKEIAPEEATIEEAPPPPEIKKANFSEMIELNIIFIDNYKKNLYNQQKSGAMKLSKAEEGLIMSMAMEAIRECAEFTVELPPPTEGIYEGIPVSQIMENITEEDVKIFLGFVKGFPGKYIGKSWKISETYATWLINNSPTG
ncbi:MAG: hypothetical protein U0457_00440 [Candidatus Sericytochromatia bacterium]